MSPTHRSGTEQRMVGAIWAQTTDGVIGDAGTMPWQVPEDLAHFKRITEGHPVIMGRRTWESFPEKFRPLPGRTNIVLTSDAAAHDRLRAAGAQPASSLEQALELAERAAGSEEIWIIGGGKVYAESLHLIDTAIITVLDLNLDGDTRAPELGAQFTCSLSDPAEGWHTSKTNTGYRFESWQRTKDLTK